MNTQMTIANHRSKPFFIIALTLLILASAFSGGCVTASVMEYAKRRAAPSNVTEFTITKVHSAQVHEHSDISVVVELDHSTHPKSGLYTITVPDPSRAENAQAIESFGFREKYIASLSDLPIYLYPMGKAKKVEERTVQSKDPPSFPLTIEELNLHPDETERVRKLVEDLNKDPAGKQKIYVVNLLSDAVDKPREGEPDKTIERNVTIEKTILLVHVPLSSSDSHPQTIAIAGAYEDESTNLYYFLVPPAVVFDAFLITVAVASGMSQVIPERIGK